MSEESRGFKWCLAPPENPHLELFKVKNEVANEPGLLFPNTRGPGALKHPSLCPVPCSRAGKAIFVLATAPNLPLLAAWAGPDYPVLLQHPQSSPNPWDNPLGFCSELCWGLLALWEDFQPRVAPRFPLVIAVCPPRRKTCPCPSLPCRYLVRCPSLASQ